MSAFSGSGNDTVTGGSRGDKIQTGSGNDTADGSNDAYGDHCEKAKKDTLIGCEN